MVSDTNGAVLNAEAQQVVNAANRNGEQAPAPTSPPPFRNMYETLFWPIELQGSYWTAVNGILRNASIAYRLDRTYQRLMRNDPALMAPLRSICMAYATAPMKIVPADRKNAMAVEIAKWVAHRLEEIPTWTDYRINIADGIWWGRSAILNRYHREAGAVVVADWMPIDPDTLCCNWEGRIGVKVGPKYLEQPAITSAGPESMVHLLDREEREAFTIARFMREGPDYWDGSATEYAHLGCGLRDRCWFVWKLKQHVLQNWGIYAQRYGMGIRKAFFQQGNPVAENAMKTAAANMIGDTTLAIPDDAAQTRRINDLEVHEPSSATADVFYTLVVRLESKLKEMIEGQSASSEATSTGLGSSVATEHARTKSDHIDYIAAICDESFTRDLIAPLVRMNFGDGVPIPKMKTQVRRPEPEKYAAAVRAIVDMGGAVAQDDVYDYLGIRIPDPDEPAFSQSTLPLLDHAA